MNPVLHHTSQNTLMSNQAKPGSSFKSFQNLKAVSAGEGFMVILRKNGSLEVYGQHFNYIGSRIFHNVSRIKAGKRIEIVYLNGIKEYYDKKLNLISLANQIELFKM